MQILLLQNAKHAAESGVLAYPIKASADAIPICVGCKTQTVHPRNTVAENGVPSHTSKAGRDERGVYSLKKRPSLSTINIKHLKGHIPLCQGNN
ncbi:MAG: hypothetical protein WC695_01475 [Candidatus Omnitrophota bacterium]